MKGLGSRIEVRGLSIEGSRVLKSRVFGLIGFRVLGFTLEVIGTRV